MAQGLTAQVCGNIASQSDIDRLLRNKSNFNNNIQTRSQDPIYIPTTFHIVRKTDGTKGVSLQAVLNQLCVLNTQYEESNIVFYLKNKTVNYINSTLLYEDPGSSANTNKIIEAKLGPGKNSVNIFITENADTNNGLGGTVLGYYDPFQDILVMRQSEVSNATETLTHEAGHFFSLMHTHNGWDQESWTAADHGIPLNSPNSPGGLVAELADGSNCGFSGDFLCDTPADYNLGFGWDNNSCSPYTGGCEDFTGELLDPEEHNYMGYFLGCDEYFFSDDQVDMMFADYESASRAYIRDDYVPNLEPIAAVDLTFPTSGETVEGYDYIQLDWSSVDNAIGYIVEVRQGIFRTYYTTTNSDVLITDLGAGKTYNWKVMPYSEIGGCQNFSEAEIFVTGTTTSTKNEASFDLSIFPTIVEGNEINVSVSESMDANITLLNVSGQVNMAKSVKLNEGNNSLSIDSNLSQGIYFLKVQSQAGEQIAKLIIQ